MPVKKNTFTILRDDLTKATDVDDFAGREVPVNMNYVEEGFLTKDTGVVPLGSTPDTLVHSLFNYQKKSGLEYFIRAKGTVLQQYSYADREWNDIAGSPTLTADAELGYAVYDDKLYFGNAVQSLYKWDGTTFTEYASAPKGNILTIFEDRLFVAGVIAEPLTAYYSNVGVPSTFTGTDVVKPLGTDKITNMVGYYGTLLIFKANTIHKLTFISNLAGSAYIPKLEVQSGTYGACSRKAVVWVENDLWFFTGQEVRSIGFQDQQTGILGINDSVISNSIKETLKQIAVDEHSQIAVFYNNRRFYLSVPIETTQNDTVFVCHTLYGNNWTKYLGRDKARCGGSCVINDIIYTHNQSSPYGVIKWTVEDVDALTQNAYLVTES